MQAHAKLRGLIVFSIQSFAHTDIKVNNDYCLSLYCYIIADFEILI